MHRLLLLLALVLFSTPAAAKWHVAESDHFVVYADDKPDDVERFSEYLERYHSAMEFLNGGKLPLPSPSNRVVIFVVGDDGDIRELAGSRRVAGFYIPRAGGSRAFVQNIRFTQRETHFSLIVLMHEYAHHYIVSSMRTSLPLWVNEGAAEFYASSRFSDDGTVSIGRPALHRAGELSFAREVSIEELLDYKRNESSRGRRGDSFYGRSWLLYHYLQFSESRRGQLSAYLRAVNDGQSSIDAGRDVFGDLGELDRELDAYVRQRRMYGFTLTPEKTTVGTINVRQLPEGEAAMMPVLIRSQRGVDHEEALELVEEAREIARKYPNDPGVQTALAEAEFDAGNDDAAIAAADRAIALDPDRPNAYVQKGYALFRKAETAEDRDAAYTEAMKPFSALNRRENDHPLPLIYYYRSFAERGLEPSENARHALERAALLAPFDHGLWFQVAIMQAQEGKIDLARRSLAPVASNPHGGPLAERASLFRDLLENAVEGEPSNPPVIVEIPDIITDDGGENDGDGEARQP
ncbi:MAG: tetratricopeptide repeat protein [Altererythrobacter sp.]